MGFLKRLLGFIIVLIVVLIGIAFALPGTAHVERSITIDRPASEVFAVLGNLRGFNRWSPWFALDPNAVYTYSGPPSGVGSKFTWAGNKDVQAGAMEIVDAKPDAALALQLDFGDMGRPMSHFALAPTTGGTRVTWSLDSTQPLAVDGKLIWNTVGRYMGLFMDHMVGPDYEKGLAGLKALVETFPNVDIAGVKGEPVQLAPRKIYFVSAASGTDPESAKAVLTVAYTKLGAYLQQNGLAMQGPPLTITTSYDKNGWKFDAGAPVARNDIATREDIQAGTTYAGPAVQFVHVGPYDKIGDTIMKAYAWLATQGYKPKDRLIEDYISDPGTTPADQLQTRLTFPVE